MTAGDLLLCELHAHTNWSDGEHSLRHLVDLYGRAGFDVLCVTDHAVPRGDSFRAHSRALDAATWREYLDAVRAEAERAASAYGLLVVPGVELSENDGAPDENAHAVVLGLDELISPDGGVVAAVHEAAAAGAAVIAAHPYDDAAGYTGRPTRRLWRDRQRLAGVVHRWELFNQNQPFPWVARAGLPAVAAGDFHRLEHLATWKTLLPCAKDERAIVGHLRSDGASYPIPFMPAHARLPARVAA